nr:MAG TPA: hypothetical protein [Caudoviricetes sp.]
MTPKPMIHRSIYILYFHKNDYKKRTFRCYR